MFKTRHLLTLALCSVLFLIGSAHTKAAVKINMRSTMEANEKITATAKGDYSLPTNI